MLLNNSYQIIQKQKKLEEYQEQVSVKARLVENKTFRSPEKFYPLGLRNKGDVVELSFVRNLENNTWIIEFITPRHTYDTPTQRILQLNGKDLLIEDVENLNNQKKRFRIKKFKDNSPIKFEDLKTFKILFGFRSLRDLLSKLSFILDFDLTKSNFDFKKINTKENKLKLKFIESINFIFQWDKKLQSDPFGSNTAYYNHLVYDIDFLDMKQNDFFYKAIEQNIELKTPNQHFIPKRNYVYDFFNKVYIKENDLEKTFNLKSKITNYTKFKHKIEYFIDKKNQWDDSKKEFIDSTKNDALGYHLPIRYNGDLNLKYQINQKIINDFLTINYWNNFPKKLFDFENELIKLYCQVINIKEEDYDTQYEHWTKKIL
ncbi:MHO_1580 family protein [Metamycoplasma alkalescens]|uniref:MHO_1580 family protein n=1 Tax=Metamycoplasma alkalescens TaxID=45363 RepID=UPI003D0720C2